VTRAVRLQGVTVGGRDDFMAMCSAMSKAKMRPVVDSVWPFEQLREAMVHLKNGAHVGKVCLRVA
ncbi:MAG: zinc-binding dehydrogenase, partial [Burkholderiaceae bacterium]